MENGENAESTVGLPEMPSNRSDQHFLGRREMDPARRRFLKQAAGMAATIGLHQHLASSVFASTEPPKLLVNHVGFTPAGAKLCIQPGTEAAMYRVTIAANDRVVLEGRFRPFSGDHGDYALADLSALREPGRYEVRCEATGSRADFEIGPDVYIAPVKKCIGYFAVQRCGDSKTGHHAPCHLDDGRRSDTGEHLDVSGGWHDACDLRKWVSATIYGMLGLSRTLDVLGPSRVDRAAILDEMRWGNRYFARMQHADGFVMDYCGGDDGNRYTDNQVGTNDDRVIHVEPCELPAQFHFVTAQASLARHFRADDPEYARNCEQAARRCLKWCAEKRAPGAAPSLAAGILACLELHRATNAPQLLETAAGFASKLIALQARDAASRDAGVAGFFWRAPDSREPYRDIMHGNLPLIALTELLDQAPEHRDAPAWADAVRQHTDYLFSLSGRSVFWIVPFGLYVNADPGGNRRVGPYWYRWTMKPRNETATPDWWVGINAHLASNGIGLIKASRVLDEPKLAAMAQRQLDWIQGANPFDASTVTDVGRNQPKLYVTNQFHPTTPAVPGGVMNGLGGDAEDRVVLDAGDYHTCEYWTPMVAYTMWLMSELSRN